MMDVGAAQKEIEIRHPVRHDQEHDRARHDECEDKTEQGAARELRRVDSRRICRQFIFRSHGIQRGGERGRARRVGSAL